MSEREILVFSDSHGHGSLIRWALLSHPAADVIHLGDGTDDLNKLSDLTAGRIIWNVSGNGEDYWGRLFVSTPAPRTQVADAYGVRMYLMHGHTAGVKGGLDTAASMAAAADCDLLLYGHTHEKHDEYLPEGTRLSDGTVLKKPLRLFNPGTVGIGFPSSYGLITIRDGVFLTSHCDEED